MSLSDKMFAIDPIGNGETWLFKQEDVKEFIKKVKEYCPRYINEIIDKLTGDLK